MQGAVDDKCDNDSDGKISSFYNQVMNKGSFQIDWELFIDLQLGISNTALKNVHNISVLNITTSIEVKNKQQNK